MSTLWAGSSKEGKSWFGVSIEMHIFFFFFFFLENR